MTTRPSLLALAIVALGSVACGAPLESGVDLDVPAFEGRGQEAAPATTDDYPPGPFGIADGSVVEDLHFYGFVTAPADVDTAEMVEISLHDFYNPAGVGRAPTGSAFAGAKLPRALIIDLAALHCHNSQNAAREMGPVYADTRRHGVEYVEVLSDGLVADVAATVEELGMWTDAFEPSFPVVIDPERTARSLDEDGLLPGQVVIDTSTMRIVKRNVGDVFDYGFLEDVVAAFGSND